MGMEIYSPDVAFVIDRGVRGKMVGAVEVVAENWGRVAGSGTGTGKPLTSACVVAAGVSRQ